MLTHHPILQLQRNLYNLPKGRERFEAYLALMKDPATGDIKLPLSGMNPMGHNHLADLLDAYLAMDVDGKAVEALKGWQSEPILQEAFANLNMQTAFVLADDAKGQWTHRVAYEFDAIYHLKPLFRRGWLVALLWSSEAADSSRALTSLRQTVYRGAWIAAHGHAATLGDLIHQEGWVAKKLGLAQQLEEEELTFTHKILKPYWNSEDEPVLLAGIFGDEAATKLGHPPLGLRSNAGIELGVSLNPQWNPS